MAEVTLTPNNTYASRETCRIAVRRVGLGDLRYIIVANDDGRYYPIFIGQDAVGRGAHFRFIVVG